MVPVGRWSRSYVASAPSACALQVRKRFGNRIFKATCSQGTCSCVAEELYPVFGIHLRLRAGMRAAIIFRLHCIR